MIELTVAIIAMVFMLLLSIVAAYLVVIHKKEVCAQDRDQNGDVHLDDICKKYLRLPNID